MRKRAVVTGATSFVGQYVLAELARHDVELYAVVRPGSARIQDLRPIANTKILLADMADCGSWMPQIGHADWFFHFGWDGIGAQGRADRGIQEKNIESSVRCFESAVKLGCTRFLFAGSQAEYGPCKEEIAETHVCRPVTPYGEAKLTTGQKLGESARRTGMNFYHARIFSVYGPGDHPWTLVSSCIRAFCKGQSIQLSSGKQSWNYLYAKDAARLLCRLVQNGAESGVYNIASHDTRNLRAFVEEIRKACGGGTAEYGGYVSRERPVDLRPDISKLLAQTGEIPFKDFGTAIKEMADAYRRMEDNN